MRRRSALLVLACLGTTFLSTPAVRAATPPLPHQIDLPADAQNLPAQLVQLSSAGKGHNLVFVEQKSPGDVVLHGVGNTTTVHDLTAGISTVDDVTYLPEAPTGGVTPTQVRVHDISTDFTVPVNGDERYLSGAGDHGVLLATSTPAGTALSLRTSTGDQLITTLPAGQLGDVTADATATLVSFTPDGASVPVIDAITLTDGTVTPVNTTALTTSEPLVALSPAAFAWSDGTTVVRVPRAGGDELRRTATGEVTALAALDDSTGWIASGHLFTDVLDPATDPVDHVAVSTPSLIAPTYGSGYAVTVTGSNNYLWLEQFTPAQTVAYPQSLSQLDAVVSDLRLTAGRLVQFENSATPGIPSLPFLVQNGEITGQTGVGRYVGLAAGRRLAAVSGRFTALGSADDTSVTVRTAGPYGVPAPGPDLTVPVSPGVDAIELSGYRLLVHRPTSTRSQLYSLGSATPVDYPLVAAIFGARVAWLNPDGSIQTKDLTTGASTTVRSADTSPCVGDQSLASTAIRVAGDEIFWSLCGENRVHRISAGTDLVLPTGDMTNARLGTGALAVLDPVTKVLSVTDVDTGNTYAIGDAPVAFDVDDRFVAWADNGYFTHLAPLPFDNSDVLPQVTAEWGDSSVVPQAYSLNRQLTFWHHQVDLTQPVTGILHIPSVGLSNSSNSVDSSWPGSVGVTYDGQDYHSSAEPPQAPGNYAWSLDLIPASGTTRSITGNLAVRDPRVARVAITSARPMTVLAGSRGTVNVKVLLGTGVMPSALLNVQARAHGTTAWKTVRTVSAGTGSAAGVLSYAIAPTTNTDYQFVHPAGTYGPLGSTSPLVTVTVLQKVTAKLSSTTVRTGTTVVLSGAVSPSKAGQVVTVQKYASGAWRSVAAVKLATTSTYRYSIKAARGSVSYRVVRAADRSNGAGTSATVVLKGT